MAFATSASSTTFNADLKRVDEALRTNPSGVLRQSLESCLKQRNSAVELHRMGMATQAQRSLHYCFDSLRIPKIGVVKVSASTENELRADVGSHDDHRIAEIHRPALAIGDAAVIENLQQHVEHIRVRLFNLVEKNHAIRLAAHKL